MNEMPTCGADCHASVQPADAIEYASRRSSLACAAPTAAATRDRGDGTNLPHAPARIGVAIPTGCRPHGAARHAVLRLADHVQTITRDIHWHIGDVSCDAQLRVVNSRTGEVIRHVNSRLAQRLVHNLKGSNEYRLDPSTQQASRVEYLTGGRASADGSVTVSARHGRCACQQGACR